MNKAFFKKISLCKITTILFLLASTTTYAKAVEVKIKIDSIRKSFYGDQDTGRLILDPRGTAVEAPLILDGLVVKLTYQRNTTLGLLANFVNSAFPRSPILGGDSAESEKLVITNSTVDHDGSILVTVRIPERFVQEKEFFKTLYIQPMYYRQSKSAAYPSGNSFNACKENIFSLKDMDLINNRDINILFSCHLQDNYNLDQITPDLDQESNFYFFGKQDLSDYGSELYKNNYFYELAFNFDDSQRTLRHEIEKIIKQYSTTQDKQTRRTYSESFEVNVTERTPKNGRRILKTPMVLIADEKCNLINFE